ncbi:MAG: ABC transporter permease [Polyangiaceae bacterium]
MSWPRLRALLEKEARRVAAQRGAVALLLLLVVSAVLASVLGVRGLGGVMGARDASLCVVDHWEEGPWLLHLKSHVPPELAPRIEFRSVANHSGYIRYPTGSVGLQLRPDDERGGYIIWTWHPPGNAEAAAFCEAWFWRESRRYFVGLAEPSMRAALARDLAALSLEGDAWALAEAHARFRERADPSGTRVPRLEVLRSPFQASTRAGPREAISMGLVLLAAFFIGIFLLPSLACEEKERGLARAIRLSPASSTEIALARFGFFFVLSLTVMVLLALISAPAALARFFTWVSLAAVALGSVGIGSVIAALAQTQRGASLGALIYLFLSSLLLLTLPGTSLEPFAALSFERRAPELLLLALSSATNAAWRELGTTLLVALVWVALGWLAERRGAVG